MWPGDRLPCPREGCCADGDLLGGMTLAIPRTRVRDHVLAHRFARQSVRRRLRSRSRRRLLVQGPRLLPFLRRPPHGRHRCAVRRSLAARGARAAVGARAALGAARSPCLHPRPHAPCSPSNGECSSAMAPIRRGARGRGPTSPRLPSCRTLVRSRGSIDDGGDATRSAAAARPSGDVPPSTRSVRCARRIRSGRAACARRAASVLVAMGVCEDVDKPTMLSVSSRFHAFLCHF